MTRGSGDARLVVLQSTPQPGPRTNPYLTQLFDALADDVRIVPFGWRAALFGRIDVFHVHWPDALVSRRRTAHAALRAVLLRIAMARFAIARIPVVRTLHNLAPHEGQRAVIRWAISAVDRSTTLDIALNPQTPTRSGRTLVVIPHGDYLPWLAAGVVPEAEPGRILHFGQIRRYKNVPALIEAFRALDEPLVLEVSGSAPNAGVAESVRAAAVGDDRVELRLGFAPDDELRRSVGRSTLVALPYAELHNSGAALLALSAARPVLVPRNAVTDDLAAEVGERWVLRYDGALDVTALRRAVEAVRVSPTGRPRLEARAWPTVAAQHVAAYRQAIALARRAGAVGHQRRYSA